MRVDWRERTTSTFQSLATVPRGIKVSAVNSDHDGAGQPSAGALYTWDSDEDDAAMSAERETAESVKRSLSLALFMRDVAGVGTVISAIVELSVWCSD